ncbi:unnamed protein product [Leptosia nina]|uniref:Uncharacterized protein n=1 Tax=Leptosia nina TaxID=320188 RepID=A0AAV1JH90_9NEOP
MKKIIYPPIFSDYGRAAYLCVRAVRKPKALCLPNLGLAFFQHVNNVIYHSRHAHNYNGNGAYYGHVPAVEMKLKLLSDMVSEAIEIRLSKQQLIVSHLRDNGAMSVGMLTITFRFDTR